MVRERQNHNGGKQQGASSSAAGSANPKVGKGAKTGKRKQPLEGKQQGTGKGMKRFPSSRSVRALCRHPDVASPMGCINACAQQGTVLQRHAPPQSFPIETRSLRVSRIRFMQCVSGSLLSVLLYDGDRLLLRLLVLVSTGDAVIQTSSDAGSQAAQPRRHYLHTKPGDCGYSIVLARYAHTNPHHMAPHRRLPVNSNQTPHERNQGHVQSLPMCPW